MDEETVLAAITAFGGRARGVVADSDTDALATRLRDAYAAEGHALHRPGSGFTPPADDLVSRLRRQVLARLPTRRRAQLRRGLDRLRSLARGMR